MAAEITISTLSEAGISYYSKNLIKFSDEQLIMAQFATHPSSLGDGKNVIFSSFVPISRSLETTNVTSGAISLTDTARTRIRQITVTPVLYAAYESFDLFDVRRMFLNYVEAASKGYGNWAGVEANYRILKCATQYALHVRADFDSNYQCVDKVDTTSNASTTGVLYVRLATGCRGKSVAANYWNGAYLTFTTGQNKGVTRIVDDSSDNATETTLTMSATAADGTFPHTPANGDYFWICQYDALASGDDLTDTVVNKAVSTLRELFAMPYEGGLYVGILDAAAEYDFYEEITSTLQYTSLGIEKIFRNEIGIYGGVRWIRSNELYREDETIFGTDVTWTMASAVDRTDGVIANVLIFGQDAYGEVDVKQESMKPRLIVKTPGKNSTNDPADLQGTLAVKYVSAPVVLDALKIIAIGTYPTALTGIVL